MDNGMCDVNLEYMTPLLLIYCVHVFCKKLVFKKLTNMAKI